ncbi:MAG TPA: asparagine synthase (glutamine-hydrolyzing) [Candidatus Krumholzibacteria bacterium]|nr:asparagine synthase (glutamine-hydrolyzing) [Candidatus Krumholzibacteria bacterium]
MCGICGLLGDVDPQHARASVKRMADCMRHRGPDDEGFFDDAPVYLGHRRLSVVDLATGHQPISNEDATIWTAYNGEIYNYPSLRSELETKGHAFRTRSDTECIVHLYEEMGADFPTKLNGMFAIALWDRARKTLVLARDRLGVKPVYYARLADGALAFASEIRALLRCPGVDTEIDPVALDSYLALQYIPGPRTIYRGVHKLPAGHTLVANAAGAVVTPFWTLEPAPAPPSFDQACDEFRALFEDAVRIRLMSDVPLGAFLSGGIDSGLVVAAMAKAMDRPVRTFSIGFEADGGYSELPYAATVASHFGTSHQTLTVSALDMQSLLPTVAVALDEPLADPAAIPTFLLSRFAREHVTVALTGEGADELFAGYDRYRLEALRDRTDVIPAAVRRGASALAGPLVGPRGRKAMRAAAMDPAAGFVHLRSVMPREMRRELLRAEVAAQVPSDHLEDRMSAYFARSSGLDAALRADTLEWLPDDLLMKVDKMTMLASLEARVPFLDYRIVEQVAGFPAEWKYRNGRSKVLLKAVAEKVLPSEIVHRPKHGFRPPIGRWLQGSLRAHLESTLLDPAALCNRWLEPRAVRGVVGRFLKGDERLALPVWVLLCLEIWLRNRDAGETAS